MVMVEKTFDGEKLNGKSSSEHSELQHLGLRLDSATIRYHSLLYVKLTKLEVHIRRPLPTDVLLNGTITSFGL